MKIEFNSILKLSVIEIIDRIKKKELSCIEYSRLCIDQVERYEGIICAFKYFNPDALLKKAEFIDSLLKDEIKIDPVNGIKPYGLYGIPVGIKDVFNTEDMPTCMGSGIWEGFTPGNDARVVTRIKRAGGIVAGKTITAEFAVHFPGPTCNPCNVEYSPGTSSSGSAAAVASYMVPLAIGTQTAGSTIRPASYCGIFGFKPSFGVVPRTGILKTLDTLDHVTFFARYLDDIEYLFEIARVQGRNYPFVHKHLQTDKQHSKKKYRLAFVKPHTWDDTAEDIKKEITTFVDSLAEDKNLEICELSLPASFTESHLIHSVLYEKALSYYFQDEFKKFPEKISNIMTRLIQRGNRITIEAYTQNLVKQVSLRNELSNFFNQNAIDAILCNSTAGIAPRLGDEEFEKPDPSLMWTLCGAPSINIPLFESLDKMPFGLQLVSRRYGDYTLLRISRYLEKNYLGR